MNGQVVLRDGLQRRPADLVAFLIFQRLDRHLAGPQCHDGHYHISDPFGRDLVALKVRQGHKR
jgi:hypothetical protein